MSWIETIETVTVPEHACFQVTPGDVYASNRDSIAMRIRLLLRSVAFRGAGAHVDVACFQAVPTCVPCLSEVPADDEPGTPEEAAAVAAARGERTMTTAELRYRFGFECGCGPVGRRFGWQCVVCREHVSARWERVCRRWASKHKAP